MQSWAKQPTPLLPPNETVWRKGLPWPDLRFHLDKNANCAVATDFHSASETHPHIPALRFDVRVRATCRSHDGGLNQGEMDPWAKRQYLAAHEDIEENKHSEHFRQAVDPASEKRLYSYGQVIKKPMDLSKIRKRLELPDLHPDGYFTVLQYQEDMELMFSNCLLFFATADATEHKSCKKLKKAYDKQQEKIKVRIIKRNRLAVMMETREFVSLQSPADPSIILTVEAGVCRWYDFKYDQQMYTPWISFRVTHWKRQDDKQSYLKWKAEPLVSYGDSCEWDDQQPDVWTEASTSFFDETRRSMQLHDTSNAEFLELLLLSVKDTIDVHGWLVGAEEPWSYSKDQTNCKVLEQLKASVRSPAPKRYWRPREDVAVHEMEKNKDSFCLVKYMEPMPVSEGVAGAAEGKEAGEEEPPSSPVHYRPFRDVEAIQRYLNRQTMEERRYSELLTGGARPCRVHFLFDWRDDGSHGDQPLPSRGSFLCKTVDACIAVLERRYGLAEGSITRRHFLISTACSRSRLLYRAVLPDLWLRDPAVDRPTLQRQIEQQRIWAANSPESASGGGSSPGATGAIICEPGCPETQVYADSAFISNRSIYDDHDVPFLPYEDDRFYPWPEDDLLQQELSLLQLPLMVVPEAVEAVAAAAVEGGKEAAGEEGEAAEGVEEKKDAEAERDDDLDDEGKEQEQEQERKEVAQDPYGHLAFLPPPGGSTQC